MVRRIFISSTGDQQYIFHLIWTITRFISGRHQLWDWLVDVGGRTIYYYGKFGTVWSMTTMENFRSGNDHFQAQMFNWCNSRVFHFFLLDKGCILGVFTDYAFSGPVAGHTAGEEELEGPSFEKCLHHKWWRQGGATKL